MLLWDVTEGGESHVLWPAVSYWKHGVKGGSSSAPGRFRDTRADSDLLHATIISLSSLVLTVGLGGNWDHNQACGIS